jgi:1-acyl-sn-glycerol-3-phosphate acyltransferase
MIVWFFRLSYLSCLLVFAFLFGVFAFDFTSFGFYVALIGSLGLAFLGAMVITLSFVRISAEFRKNKAIDDVFNHHIANSLLILARNLLRIKIIVSGREHIPSKPFILVANHQENYDIIVLKPIFEGLPLDFIAKEALFRTPIIGKWVQILGNIPISREADRAAAESIVRGIKLYKKGIPVGIFPEGKRSFSNTMLPFKAGAFKLAMKPKADLLVVTQYNVVNTFKGWPFKKQKIHVHIHPLVTYDAYKDKSSQELADFVKDMIQEQLDRFEEKHG